MNSNKVEFPELINSAVSEIRGTDVYSERVNISEEASETKLNILNHKYLLKIPQEILLKNTNYYLRPKDRFKGSIKTQNGTIHFIYNCDLEQSLIIYREEDKHEQFNRIIQLKLEVLISNSDLKVPTYVEKYIENKTLPWFLSLKEITDSIYDKPNSAEVVYNKLINI